MPGWYEIDKDLQWDIYSSDTLLIEPISAIHSLTMTQCNLSALINDEKHSIAMEKVYLYSLPKKHGIQACCDYLINHHYC